MPQPSLPVAPPSAPFRISPGEYFRHALAGTRGKAALAISGAAAALPALAAAITSDLRFALVALMVIFIAIPMVMALIYFHVTLSPEATRETLPHTAELRPDGSVAIVYLPPAEDDSAIRHAPPPELITPGQIKSLRLARASFVVTLRSGRIVIIPVAALQLDDEWHCHFRDFD